MTKYRLVSGHELMLFFGYPREKIDDLYKFDSSTLAKVAGRAFSGFAVMPVIMTALFGAGKLGITGDPEQ